MIKVLGLDNKEYKLRLPGSVRKSCSLLHLRARLVLNKLFPLESIFEELTLPGSGMNRKPLTADFYIHSIKLMVEVQGQQHFVYNTMFHENKSDLYKSKVKDNNKKTWCEINDIVLIELPYSESDNEWEARINNRR